MANEPAPAAIRMPNIGEAGPRPYREQPGPIVCFCERVTRGEIDAALDSPIRHATRTASGAGPGR